MNQRLTKAELSALEIGQRRRPGPVRLAALKLGVSRQRIYQILKQRGTLVGYEPLGDGRGRRGGLLTAKWVRIALEAGLETTESLVRMSRRFFTPGAWRLIEAGKKRARLR